MLIYEAMYVYILLLGPVAAQILRTDHRSTRGIDDQFLFGDVLRAHCPYPCASHIMCCAFFTKFQDNTCRSKVEIIMETN